MLQHAHEIVKKILFHDLAVFVPARNSAEIHVETLVRRLDHRSAGHRHRTCHRSAEIRHSARPFALGQHDLVWIVDEMLVRKRLEERNRFLFVGVYASARAGIFLRSCSTSLFRHEAPLSHSLEDVGSEEAQEHADSSSLALYA